MNSCRFVVLCVIFWCSNYVPKVLCDNHKALIFNRRNEILVEKDPYDDYAQCIKCFTACPNAQVTTSSSSSHSNNPTKESILNEYASISGYGVFFKNIYNALEQNEDDLFTYMKDIDAVCNEPLTPAIVVDRNTPHKIFEIGYELFFDMGMLNLQCYDYTKYVKLGANGQADYERTPPNNSEIQSFDNNGLFTFKVHNDARFSVFYWISVLSIDVRGAGDTRVINIMKDTVNNYHGAITIRTCNSYFSGGGRIPLYENQSNTSSSSTANIPDLVKTQIAPMRMFHTLAGRLATCVYLNIAFIWRSIKTQQLKNTDLFLYAMYRKWPANIFINFGASGESTTLNAREQNLLFNSEDRLLEQFPIPKVLFRIVEFHFNMQIFDVAIIIHNEVDVEKIEEDDLICTDMMEGWEDIVNDGSDIEVPGVTYACQMSQQVADKLGVERSIPQSHFLNLKALPFFTMPTGQIIVADQLFRVREELTFIRDEGIQD